MLLLQSAGPEKNGSSVAVAATGITVAVQATGGVINCGGGSDALLADTVTRKDSVIVAYTVGGTESRYVTDPTQLS